MRRWIVALDLSAVCVVFVAIGVVVVVIVVVVVVVNVATITNTFPTRQHKISAVIGFPGAIMDFLERPQWRTRNDLRLRNAPT